MITTIPLEDTFGDITRKASSGKQVGASQLASMAGIAAPRLEKLLNDAERPTPAEARAVAEALHLDPGKLTDSGLQQWYPQPFKAPSFLQHQINAPYPSNGYFLILKEAGIAAFVDPAGSPAPIIETLRRSKVALTYILLTHKHRDHSDALGAVRKAFPDAQPVIHELDAKEVGSAAHGAIPIRDGGRLPFGDASIEMLHTPGHTDGSSCFIYKGMIFTGDELFAGSIGRDFGERFHYSDQLAAIRQKILSLPGETVVLPGHGPASTVAQEQAHNPFF
ncbi:MAG: MBL fold metallo-hydrolase [Candidatus Eremiobacteraeota bacterium]|nr:MBL fold metallo-hydrolase [Candidatus Eremiobacteraeota bacterium]